MIDSELAEAWLANCRDAIRSGSDSDDANATFWAYSELDRLCSTDPERALKVIGLIAHAGVEDRVMYNLAAGPLEDLLVRHGDKVIDQIEALARQDGLVLFLVSAVWTERMTSDIRGRVQKLIERAEGHGVGPQGQHPTKH
jgi:hypothetical protein